MKQFSVLDIPERAEVNLHSLERIFTVPESNGATLAKIEQDISTNLDGFLREHIVAEEKPMPEIEAEFSNVEITERPLYVSDYTNFILKHLVAQSVHTAAPSFIGHMTTALPYFMLPMMKIVTALNQNLVKVETSKAFTPMERQVIGMMHKLVYDRQPDFYDHWLHNYTHSLGAFCSGGTVANLTALWAARNACLGEQQISRQGVHGALSAKGLKGLVVLVSERGHYSLLKAVDVLGLGRDNLITVPTDAEHKVNVDQMRARAQSLQAEGYGVMAIVGVAGATETGSVDPLDALADLAEELGCHYHVDAAWGAPTLFSHKYKHLLDGMQRADSVTLDPHKQFYVPMGAGMAVFKDPAIVKSIQLHAEYIIREGSRDLGQNSLEGSRPGMAMLVHAGLHIIGRRGYELLIDQGIEKAKYFAAMIELHKDFELLVHPELNILGYRYIPEWVQTWLARADERTTGWINQQVDVISKNIQKAQRAEGKTFVSRTRVSMQKYYGQKVIYYRAVLANPLTSADDLVTVLEEQEDLAQHEFIQNILETMRRRMEEGDRPQLSVI